MGLDITIKSIKEIRCPHCGEFIEIKTIQSVDSSGRAWYDLLGQFGYDDEWYAEDMELTYVQALALSSYACDNNLYNWQEIDDLVSSSLSDNSKIVINADW